MYLNTHNLIAVKLIMYLSVCALLPSSPSSYAELLSLSKTLLTWPSAPLLNISFIDDLSFPTLLLVVASSKERGDEKRQRLLQRFTRDLSSDKIGPLPYGT